MPCDEEDLDLWAERVHAMLAEGRHDEAMQAFHDQFPALRTPQHESRLAARIAAGRQKELAL